MPGWADRTKHHWAPWCRLCLATGRCLVPSSFCRRLAARLCTRKAWFLRRLDQKQHVHLESWLFPTFTLNDQILKLWWDTNWRLRFSNQQRQREYVFDYLILFVYIWDDLSGSSLSASHLLPVSSVWMLPWWGDLPPLFPPLVPLVPLKKPFRILKSWPTSNGSNGKAPQFQEHHLSVPTATSCIQGGGIKSYDSTSKISWSHGEATLNELTTSYRHTGTMTSTGSEVALDSGSH